MEYTRTGIVRALCIRGRKAHNRQQGLMLLRGQSHGSGRHFTKAQKLAQIKAKRSQFLVFFSCDAMRCAIFSAIIRWVFRALPE
jgi:hypothetical protein